jgi:hypothetical protein
MSSKSGLWGFLRVDKSVDANVLAAHGTETNAGIPYNTDSKLAMLLKETVAYTPVSKAE